jgi:hypothetical protein
MPSELLIIGEAHIDDIRSYLEYLSSEKYIKDFCRNTPLPHIKILHYTSRIPYLDRLLGGSIERRLRKYAEEFRNVAEDLVKPFFTLLETLEDNSSRIVSSYKPEVIFSEGDQYVERISKVTGIGIVEFKIPEAKEEDVYENELISQTISESNKHKKTIAFMGSEHVKKAKEEIESKELSVQAIMLSQTNFLEAHIQKVFKKHFKL